MLQVQLATRAVGILESKLPQEFTPAQRRGLRYQEKVEKALKRVFFPDYVLSRPWFRYKSIDGAVKKCQPDVLITHSWGISIVEVKYTTTAEAWDKLLNVYRPVVEKAYRAPTALVLVTRMFDPAVKFSCPIEQLEGLEHMAQWRGEGLGVVSWR
jgi:hypothetical protein